jgi:hypothetical protein
MTVADRLPDFEKRVETVIGANRGRERVWTFLTVVLFGLGIIAAVKALMSGQYLWTIPSGVISVFLSQPLHQLWNIRRENIALSLAPALIRELPADSAAMNIQRMLDNLYPPEKQ